MLLTSGPQGGERVRTGTADLSGFQTLFYYLFICDPVIDYSGNCSGCDTAQRLLGLAADLLMTP